MPKIPVSIGRRHFESKGDALEFFKNVLNGYSPGELVSKDHNQFLSDAIEKHPDAAEKIGSGISHFSVGSADYGTQCFWVHRNDGSRDRFSYKSCVN